MACASSSKPAEDLSPLHQLKDALEFILDDESFKAMPTHLARGALDNARSLLVWVTDEVNVELAKAFSKWLVGTLESCFSQTGSLSLHVKRERMCERLYKARSSDHYRDVWVKFLLASIRSKACPVFYQAVTDRVMEELIKSHFPVVSDKSNDCQHVTPLDSIEKKVVRYMAGSVVRALVKKAARMSHPSKEEIILCLTELVDDEEGNRDCDTEEWVNFIDRGGLIHVDDTLYSMFIEMEMEMRKFLNHATEDVGVRKMSLDGVKSSSSVNYYWSLVSVNWEQEEAAVLLDMITIRGFSHAGAFVEKYKQKHQKTVEKSKGLRKKLQVDSDDK